MNQPTISSARLTAGQWQKIIDQQQASGMSQKDFCRDRNIGLSTFTNWKRKLGGKATATPKETLTPPDEAWIEIPSATREVATQPWHLELELPGGVTLRMRQ